jgi:hypothetical protein
MDYIKPSEMDDGEADDRGADDHRRWMTSRSDDDTFGDDRSG